ncbi:MAG: hypothetical protein ABL962_13710 [Fimbriimonadaceae bacterium]
MIEIVLDGGRTMRVIADHKGGLDGFIAELLRWCRERLRHAKARPHIVEAMEREGGRLADDRVRTVAKRIAASRSTTHAALVALVAAGVIAQEGAELVPRQGAS